MDRWTWVLTLVVIIGLAGCAGAKPSREEVQTSQSEPTLKKIARTGVFTVGT